MLRYSPLIIAAWIVAAAGALWHAATHLDINTDTAGLISAELPFRRAYEDYRRAFPLQADSLVVVIDGQTPEQAEQAAVALGAALQQQPQLFSDVDVPGTGAFFIRNAFLYLSEQELDDLSNRLVEAQPFLGLIERDPSLRGFSHTLEQVLTAPAGNPIKGLAPVLKEFRNAVQAEAASSSYRVSWQKMLAGDSPTVTSARRFVLARPILDSRDLFAAAAPIGAIRRIAAELNFTPDTGVRIRITGDAALSYEELNSALAGTKLSNVLALIIVTVLLAYGLRSLWLTAASLASMIVGLSITAGFASLAVGRLNLISLAFAVLYIGLSVDYAINFCLRYRECLIDVPDRSQALWIATKAVGKPLLMCAVATAIGFYAFLPTDFDGVAELGLISGTGILINLAVTLTLLPALLQLVPAPRAGITSVLLPAWFRDLPYRHARTIRGVALLLGVAALVSLPQLSFDRNPLNLREASSESVATIRDLMADRDHPAMTITVLAPDRQAARLQAEKLKSLPEVDQVISVEDFTPQMTDRKLAAIDELSLLVAPQLAPAQTATPASPAGQRAALGSLAQTLLRFAATNHDADHEAARELAGTLNALLASLDRAEPKDVARHLESLQDRLLGTLPVNLDRLRAALEPKTPEDLQLPAYIHDRWVTPAGMERISVAPKEDINRNDSLRRFVDAVEKVAPEATDEPVLTLRSGDTVVKAFGQALVLAAIGILIVVLALLRSLKATALVALPLALASLLTSASMVLLKIPFNFANVLALPLLLGVGVDFGILIVQRMGQDPAGVTDPLATSTARAVLFSGLATTCGIGNLAFSPHPGTASMGLVLFVGLSWCVFCTLVVLPAFIAPAQQPSRRTS